MRLRRVEIRDFRKIGHLVIEGLADGLNVLVGDNEAGKSTVLAALRAVLFERHRVGGKVVAAMLPHGQEVRPEITIDFEVNGDAFRLRKAFNQRPEAELIGPGAQKATGDAVEERLAALLGFQAPGSRGSKPDEHQGVYGLLWVDQGLAHTPLNSGGGQATLASALETEVGQVLGGERGRHLLAAAERRRDDFWDKRDTPKPRGAFRTAQESILKLDAQRDELDRRLRVHDEKVAALAGKAEILQRHARDDRLAGAARAVDLARATAARAVSLEATLAELGKTRRRAELDRDAAAEKVLARKTLAAQLDTAGASTTLARSEADTAAAGLTLATRAAAEAGARWTAARLARDEADKALAALERASARHKARQDFARAATTLADAEDIAAKRQTARAAAAAIAASKKDLADLDRLCAECDQARAKRDAASVRIEFSAGAGAAASVDGVPHALSDPLLLARDAVLDLAGFGRLAIKPGGGAVALAQAVEVAERRVEDRLRQLAQPSRNDLANALARKADAEAEVASHERVFAVLAPHGIEVLRDALRVLEAATEPGHPTPATTPDETERTTLRRVRTDRLAAEKDAAAAAATTDAAREKAAHQAAILADRAEVASRGREAAASALAAARQAVADDRLDAVTAEVHRALALAAEAEAAARVARDAADPETTALALRRAEGAEAAIRQDIATLSHDKLVLETELRTLGQEGLGELLDETEGQIALLRQQLASTTLEAHASLLLHKTLAAAQRESKDRWLGPVRERVRPYLKLIQPDSEIVLNENTFSIEHLVRGGVSEPFDTLSVGAREQVAVITRLALADILRASGRPSAIILDDALVNTDEGRLERMHLVLQKAAQTLQVIVLTCRERDFLSLGVPIRRL